ncbi:unnamed protein product [Phytophthora fragariaefolia]|uniref:Unnamed protein product n=1 Tax=Phytophthora fragariaefolia TaxID=1490495 RepID=A0A9W7DF94_9STRA|nr:unnamed protein product [Phytophthora fragariaefolia]
MASATNTPMPSLHPTIRSRLNLLKRQCHEVCGDVADGPARSSSTTSPLHQLLSSVQLWKERSLHHTLQALDKAGSPCVDSHMEAIEDHEKAARHLFELTRGVVDRAWQDTNNLLDGFADDLAALVHEIVTATLEEQRLIHDSQVKNLQRENQRLAGAWQELKDVNGDLERRLEVIENTPNAGGDAILCNKLRSKLQHLAIKQHECSVELEKAAEERVGHRRELEKVKAQLAHAQKALALTRAMHDKETRQLATMLQLSHTQVHQVLEASRKASENAAHPRRPQQLERFDPLSGCMIVHLAPITPQKPQGSPIATSPRCASSPVLAMSPNYKQPGAPSQTPRQRLERPKSASPAGRRRSSVASTNGDKAPPPSTKLFRPLSYK